MNDYINYGNFIFDLFSILPLDYILLLSGVTDFNVAIVRLVRIAKVFRISEILGILRIKYNLTLTKYSMLLSVYIIVIFSHLCGCFFYWMGDIETGNKTRF